ncbi:RIP metalloprotease, partial [Cribrihabitans sp. XS_ASV171]
GKPLPHFSDITSWEGFFADQPAARTVEYTVRRDGQDRVVQGPWLYPPRIAQVAPRSAAMDIELKADDVITAVDGEEIFAFSQLKEKVESSDGRVLLLDVWRNGETLEFALKPRRTDEPQPDGGFITHWRIGIVGGMALEPAAEPMGFFAAVSDGAGQTWRIVEGSLSGIWHMITGAISTCNISGPIGIAETSSAMASQGAQSFIWFIAVLSTAVGLLNLFPIPVLDGGHLVFYAYEAVTGRPPSDKVLRVLMAVGLTLILSLMVFS